MSRVVNLPIMHKQIIMLIQQENTYADNVYILHYYCAHMHIAKLAKSHPYLCHLLRSQISSCFCSRSRLAACKYSLHEMLQFFSIEEFSQLKSIIGAQNSHVGCTDWYGCHVDASYICGVGVIPETGTQWKMNKNAFIATRRSEIRCSQLGSTLRVLSPFSHIVVREQH